MWQHWCRLVLKCLYNIYLYSINNTCIILLFWKYDNLFSIFCWLKSRGSPAFPSWITKWEEKNMTFLVTGGPVNMTRVWDKEKIWVSDRNLTHHLANTGKVLYLLSYKLSWRVRSFNWVHLTGILHTARISTVEVVSVRDSRFFLFALIMLISSLNTHFIIPRLKFTIFIHLSDDFSWSYMLVYFSSLNLTDLYLRKQWPIVVLINARKPKK